MNHLLEVSRCLIRSKSRGLLFTVAAVFSLYLLLFPVSTAPVQYVVPSHTISQGSRIAKVSMLYDVSADRSSDHYEIYDRALKSHALHNERHGYPMHVLRNHISEGFWNKPQYLLALVINELVKSEGERTEWLMQVLPHTGLLYTSADSDMKVGRRRPCLNQPLYPTLRLPPTLEIPLLHDPLRGQQRPKRAQHGDVLHARI